MGNPGQIRQNRRQGRPEATVPLNRGGNVGRHALLVIVEQRESRLSRPIADVVAGARNNVVCGAVEAGLGDDAHVHRQAVAQGAERTVNRNAPRRTGRHHASAAIVAQRAVTIKRDALGQRAAVLGEER